MGLRVTEGFALVRGRGELRRRYTFVAPHKCAPPFTEAEFEIRYGTGVDTCAELIDLGLARGLVEKSGNHLSFGGTTLGNGREKSRDALVQSAELQSTMRQAIAASGPVRPGRREAAA